MNDLVHYLTIIPKEKFNKWVAGELFFDPYEKKLVAISDENEEYCDELQSYSDFTYGQYNRLEEHYKTEHGDEVVAFGYYGND